VIVCSAMAFRSMAAEEVQNVADLPNFHEVIPQALYRGGQPTDIGIQNLASQYHIQKIIDLRNEDFNRAKEEYALAMSLGMEVLSYPMSALRKPSSQAMSQIENLLKGASAEQPIFIHCLHGEDRTGLVMGLFRVLVQKVDPKVAYAEMLYYGFHPLFFELTKYFWDHSKVEEIFDNNLAL
jgi:tyrosine-protein phosphatase SIW14